MTPDVLDAIADLERRVVAVDGGRLKLEWGTLRARSGEPIEDLLWWADDRLVGFLGLYGFGRPTVELSGMVDPEFRRQGIGRDLLAAALPRCVEQGYTRALLIVPRASVGGAALAISFGGRLEHSEHALVLRGEPASGPDDPALVARRATEADVPEIVRLLADGFGDGAVGDPARIRDELDEQRMIELDRVPVGVVRLSETGGVGGIYGFVVDATRRGQGIGRQALRRFCAELRAAGCHTIGLEVAVDNESALGLYTSVGFAPVTTEDYYELPLPR